MTSREPESLRWANSEKYGPDFGSHLMEQYKLTVQMADTLSSRRVATNQFYLAASAALLSVVVVLSGTSPSLLPSTTLVVVSLSLIGVVLSVVWALSIATYRSLNAVKFRLINEMESRLPVNPYESEWAMLQPSSDLEMSDLRSKHRQLTSLELVVPYLFIALFVVTIGLQVVHLL